MKRLIQRTMALVETPHKLSLLGIWRRSAVSRQFSSAFLIATLTVVLLMSATRVGAVPMDISSELPKTLTQVAVDGGSLNLPTTVGVSGATVPILATIDFNPNTLNLKSKGNYVTAYIELPKDYDVSKIDVSSVKLNMNSVVPALLKPTALGDYDKDGIQDLMVKFDRQEVQEVIDNLHIWDSYGFGYGPGPGKIAVPLTVSGMVGDLPFEGRDEVMVMNTDEVRVSEKNAADDLGGMVLASMAVTGAVVLRTVTKKKGNIRNP